MGTVTFRDITELAQFCAELTRQGIAYSAIYSGDEYIVTLTGY